MNRIHFPLLVVLAGLLMTSELAAQAADTTTIFVVRHADRIGDKDELTAAGETRAEQLGRSMELFRVGAIHSTGSMRTRATAKQQGIKINHYDPKPAARYKEMLKKHAGQSVLIVGHSTRAA